MRSQFSEWKISINDNVLRFTLDESIKEEQASLAMQQANPKYHAPAYWKFSHASKWADRILDRASGRSHPRCEACYWCDGDDLFIRLLIRRCTDHAYAWWGICTCLFRATGVNGRVHYWCIRIGWRVWRQPEVNLVLSSARQQMSDFSRSNIGKPMGADLYTANIIKISETTNLFNGMKWSTLLRSKAN